MIGKLIFLVLMSLLYCVVVGSLFYAVAWVTGRSFLEVLGDLWIAVPFSFVATMSSVLKITKEEDSAGRG